MSRPGNTGLLPPKPPAHLRSRALAGARAAATAPAASARGFALRRIDVALATTLALLLLAHAVLPAQITGRVDVTSRAAARAAAESAVRQELGISVVACVPRPARDVEVEP